MKTLTKSDTNVAHTLAAQIIDAKQKVRMRLLKSPTVTGGGAIIKTNSLADFYYEMKRQGKIYARHLANGDMQFELEQISGGKCGMVVVRYSPAIN